MLIGTAAKISETCQKATTNIITFLGFGSFDAHCRLTDVTHHLNVIFLGLQITVGLDYFL